MKFEFNGNNDVNEALKDHVSEKTLAIIDISVAGVQIAACVGTGKILKQVVDTVITAETKPIPKILMKVGGVFIGWAIDDMICDKVNDLGTLVKTGIAFAKAAKDGIEEAKKATNEAIEKTINEEKENAGEE